MAASSTVVDTRDRRRFQQLIMRGVVLPLLRYVKGSHTNLDEVRRQLHQIAR